ncbi:unnamed protein product [Didymodactylos carnosus]|nr:unnamed protein product [Didymodactylos carnosus]CAF3970614.1 unnamed protein product [Didymodactylos carnosus]
MGETNMYVILAKYLSFGGPNGNDKTTQYCEFLLANLYVDDPDRDQVQRWLNQFQQEQTANTRRIDMTRSLLVQPQVFSKPISPGCVRRIENERNDWIFRKPIFMDRLSDKDEFNWEVIIHGPTNTPYENGKFKIHIRFTELYPLKPPNCQMVTTIFHPNIDKSSGEICLDLLRENWKSTLTIGNILKGIFDLLQEPTAEYCMQPDKGILYLTNRDEFNRLAKEYTVTYAI